MWEETSVMDQTKSRMQKRRLNYGFQMASRSGSTAKQVGSTRRSRGSPGSIMDSPVTQTAGWLTISAKSAIFRVETMFSEAVIPTSLVL